MAYSFTAFAEKVDKTMKVIEKNIENGDEKFAAVLDSAMNMSKAAKPAKGHHGTTITPSVSSVSKPTGGGTDKPPKPEDHPLYNLLENLSTKHLHQMHDLVANSVAVRGLLGEMSKSSGTKASASVKAGADTLGEAAKAGDQNQSKALKTADKNFKALAKTTIGKSLSQFFKDLNFDENQAKKLSDAMNALENVFSLADKMEAKKQAKKASFADVVSGRQSAMGYLKNRFQSTKSGIKELEKQVKTLAKSSIGKDISSFFKQFDVTRGDIDRVQDTLHVFQMLTSLSGVGFKLLRVGMIIKLVDKLHIGESIGHIVATIGNGIQDAEKAKVAVEVIKAVAGNLFKFSISLATSLPFLIIGLIAIPLIKKVLTGLTGAFSAIGEKAKVVTAGAKAMRTVTLAFAISLIALVAAGAIVLSSVKNVIVGIAMLALVSFTFMMIGKKAKAISKGAHAIKSVAMALGMFGLGMLLFSTLVATNPMGAIIGLGLLAMTAAIFFFIGEFKHIRQGALTVMLMGLSLGLFGFGAFLLGMLLVKNPLGIIIGIGVIGVSALLFYFIGTEWVHIAKGAIVVILIGISLILFSIGLKLFIDATKDMTWEKGGIMALVIGGAGLLFAGVGVLAEPIAMGAIAMSLVGIALLIMSPGLWAISKINWKDIDALNMGLTLGAITVGFAAAGLASMFVIAGGLAMGAVGIALASVAHGVKEWIAADVDSFDIDKAKKIIMGLADAFAVAGSDSPPTNVLSFLTGVQLGKNNVERGIDSVLNADRALQSIAKGLKAFDEYTKDLNLNDPKKDPGSLVARIANVILMVSNTFAQVGKTGNEGGSLMKLMFGNDFKKSDVEVGIDAVMNAGKALKSIAAGLKEFDDMTKELNLAPYDDALGKSTQSLNWKIANVIGMINASFSAIGKSGNDGFSLTKVIFGNDFKKSDVEVGIDAVKSAGDAFKTIATGLKEFDAMTNELNLSPAEAKDPKSINYKIATVLGMIRASFASIGQSKSGGGGILGAVFGIDTSDNLVQDGIDAVKGVGKELIDIGEALKLWSDLDTQKIDVNKLASNIGYVVGIIRTAFAMVGGAGEVPGSGLFSIFTGDENVVQKGIESIKGAGEELKNIADALKIYNDIDKQGIDVQKVGGNIQFVMGIVRAVFSAIGEPKMIEKVNMFGIKVMEPSDDNLVQKGIEAVKGAGGELKNIADAIKVFNDLTKEGIDITKVGQNITDILNVVRRSFAAVGGDPAAMTEMGFKMATNEENVQKGIKAVSGAGEQLKTIAESVKTFAEAEKSGGLNIAKIRDTISGVLTIVVQEFAAIGDEKAAQQLGRMFFSPDAVSSGVDSAKDAVKGIKEIADTINGLGKLTENWTKIKPLIGDLLQTPINSIGQLTQQYQPGVIIQFVNNVIEPVRQLYEKFAGTYQRYVGIGASEKRDKDGGVMGHFAGDLGKLLKVLKADLKKSDVDNFSVITTNLATLAKIASDFERFEKVFKEFAEKDLKTMSENLNKIDIDRLGSLSTMMVAISDIAKQSPDKLKENIDQVEALTIAIVNALKDTGVITGLTSDGTTDGSTPGMVPPAPPTGPQGPPVIIPVPQPLPPGSNPLPHGSIGFLAQAIADAVWAKAGTAGPLPVIVNR